MNKNGMEYKEKELRAEADKDIEIKVKSMRRAWALDQKARKSFQDLSDRLRKVKRNRWITDIYGLSSGMLSKFAKDPHMGMSYINYLRLSEAVSILENKEK